MVCRRNDLDLLTGPSDPCTLTAAGGDLTCIPLGAMLTKPFLFLCRAIIHFHHGLETSQVTI